MSINSKEIKGGRLQSALKPGGAVKAALVCSEFHKGLVERLHQGAKKGFSDYPVSAMAPLWVPGSGEIPLAARWLIEKEKPCGLLALGAVIQGETPHFESLRRILDQGLLSLQERFSIPIVFAVLFVESRAQAIDRLGGSKGHRGEQAARALCKMIALKKRLSL